MTVVATAKSTAVKLRLPEPALLKRIDAAAGKAGRSRNTEIIFRLHQSFQRQSK